MYHEFHKTTLLPDFPSTRHLPLEPNASSDDKVCSEAEMLVFLASGTVTAEEKVDGANSRIALWEGQPVIGNRNHILDKAYTQGQKLTPAKQQFTAIWGWFYERAMERLMALETLLGFVPSVYGEWCYARAATPYAEIPEWFLAYDVYDHARRLFLPPAAAREALASVGFSVVPLVAASKTGFTPKELLALRDGPSAYGGTPREGIYLKSDDGERMTGRFKMVAPWFASNPSWNKKALVRNRVAR